MEDLAGKLNSILNSPEGMKQVQELAGMLGLNPQSGASPPPAAPAPAAAPVPAPLAGVSPDMVNAMMRMAPLFVNGQQSAARGKDPRLAGMVRAAERVSPFRII